VGTTKFDKLIEVTASKAFHDFVSQEYGTRRIIFQIGQGTHIPQSFNHGVVVEWFRLRPDVSEVLKESDLVITHCGAGSVMDAMKANKKVVAVVNRSLMDNHQTELACAMADEGPYLFAVENPERLVGVLKSANFDKLVPWTQPRYDIFKDAVLSFIQTE
jgi:beta-1,4-N-acetylglucosaminyltransferase